MWGHLGGRPGICVGVFGVGIGVENNDIQERQGGPAGGLPCGD